MSGLSPIGGSAAIGRVPSRESFTEWVILDDSWEEQSLKSQSGFSDDDMEWDNASDRQSPLPENGSEITPPTRVNSDASLLISDQVGGQDKPTPNTLEARPPLSGERNFSVIIPDQAEGSVNMPIREEPSQRRTPLDCIYSTQIRKQSALDFLFSIPTKIRSFFFEQKKAFLLGIKLLIGATIIILVAKAVRLPSLFFMLREQMQWA